jgi:hypothetical protein
MHDWDEVTLGITPQTIPPKTYLALRILSDSALQMHLDAEKAKRKGKKGNDPGRTINELLWSRICWRIAQTFDEGTTTPVYVSLLTISGSELRWFDGFMD